MICTSVLAHQRALTRTLSADADSLNFGCVSAELEGAGARSRARIGWHRDRGRRNRADERRPPVLHPTRPKYHTPLRHDSMTVASRDPPARIGRTWRLRYAFNPGSRLVRVWGRRGPCVRACMCIAFVV